jgi:hypothetical protein
MSDTEPDENEEPDEKGRKKSSGTTLTLEEWFEELNKCDRLHQYAKKRRGKGDEEKRKEPKEGTLTEEEWIEELNQYDRLSQYAKRRKEKESGKDDK